MEKKEKYSTKNLNHGTIYTYHFFFGFIDHRLACAYNSPLLDGLAYTFLSPTIFFIVRQNDLNFFFFLSAELGGGGGYSRQLEAVKGRTPSSSSFRGGKQNKKRLWKMWTFILWVSGEFWVYLDWELRFEITPLGHPARFSSFIPLLLLFLFLFYITFPSFGRNRWSPARAARGCFSLCVCTPRPFPNGF